MPKMTEAQIKRLEWLKELLVKKHSIQEIAVTMEESVSTIHNLIYYHNLKRTNKCARNKQKNECAFYKKWITKAWVNETNE